MTVRKKRKKVHKLISPDGVVFKTTNLLQFAEEHGLLWRKVYALAAGERMTYKGWQSTHPKAVRRIKKKTKCIVNILTKEQITVFNRSAILEVLDFTKCAFSHFLNGGKLVYKDWILKENLELIEGFAQ